MAMTTSQALVLHQVWVEVFAFQEGALTDREMDLMWQQEAELRAEMAYERYLEDRGWQEAVAFQAYEDSLGLINPFEQEARREDEAEARCEEDAARWAANHPLA